MYKSIRIQNFRAFEDVTVGPLARVNLIGGKNNSGKTTLLEALSIPSDPSDPLVIPYADDFRANLETDPDEKLLAVFRMFDPSNEIVLSIKGDWGESERTLNVRLEDAGTVQLDIQQNSSLGKRGKKKLILHYVDDIGVESVTEGSAVHYTTGSGSRQRYGNWIGNDASDY